MSFALLCFESLRRRLVLVHPSNIEFSVLLRFDYMYQHSFVAIYVYASASLLLTNFFLLLACCSYLLILDRTNWKTNILTALLIPYIYLTLPSVLFNLLRLVCIVWTTLLYFLSSFFFFLSLLRAADCLVIQWRGWKMDCFHCRCPAAFLPSTFPRYMYM